MADSEEDIYGKKFSEMVCFLNSTLYIFPFEISFVIDIKMLAGSIKVPRLLSADLDMWPLMQDFH